MKPPPGKGGGEPFNNPFAALEGKRASLPDGPPPMPARKDAPKGPARAVVRLEKKGRRGKEVTLVEHLALRPDQLLEWLKALKSSLGCGGTLEGEALVLQGDQRDRVGPLLTARGVRKVVSG